MPTQIECRVQGSNAVPAVTELGNRVIERDGRMLMENPETVAAGDGWITVEFPEDDRADAEAILNSMLDQIPGARDSIRPGPPGEGLDPS